MHLNYLVNLFVKYEDIEMKQLMDKDDIETFNKLKNFVKNSRGIIECKEEESEGVQTEIRKHDLVERIFNNSEIDIIRKNYSDENDEIKNLDNETVEDNIEENNADEQINEGLY
uniref:Uncharacterized protein n=1 Tax=Meloidogyne javanica TaxID=6303 RepID=A0A915LRA2_MELJA